VAPVRGEQGCSALDHPGVVGPVEPLDQLVIGVLALEVAELPRTRGRFDLQLVGDRAAGSLGGLLVLGGF
jgi:hypothetical protein